MKKRIISALLALATAISLSACNTKTEDTEANQEQTTAQQEETQKAENTVTDKSYTINSITGTYTGEWNDNCPNGYGTFKSKSIYLEGTWIDGNLHGQGEYLYKSEDGEEIYYNGTYSHGKYEGQGYMRIIYSNGLEQHMKGEFHNSALNGYAEYIEIGTDYRVKLQGNFVNYQSSGKMKAVYYGSDGKIQKTGILENDEFTSDEYLKQEELVKDIGAVIAEMEGYGDLYDKYASDFFELLR